MRGYELVSQFRLAGDDAVYLVVDVNFIHEVLANMTQEFVQIRVVVVDVAGIWCMVVILLQYGKGDTAVDAQRVNRHETLVARLLLNYRELTVAEVLRTDSNQVGVSLTKVAAQHEHIAHLLQRLDLVLAQFQHLLRAEAVCRLLAYFKMIDVRDFIRRERNLAGDIVRDVNLAVTWIQFHSVLRRPVQNRNQVRLHMSDGGILQSLVCEEWHKVVPEHAADHSGHNGTTKLPLDALQLVDQHTVVLLYLRMRTRLDLAHLRDTFNHRAFTQVK